jgi:hypothetical protein
MVVYRYLFPLSRPACEIDKTRGDVGAKDITGIITAIIVDQPKSLDIDKKVVLNPLSKIRRFILEDGHDGQIDRNTQVFITDFYASLVSDYVRNVREVIRRRKAKVN